MGARDANAAGGIAPAGRAVRAVLSGADQGSGLAALLPAPMVSLKNWTMRSLK